MTIYNISIQMSPPLNPLVVARLRKYWLGADITLGELIYTLEGWIHILGPGPHIPQCDNCQKDLSLDWKICKYCPKNSTPTPICPQCYQCAACEDAEEEVGCCICGTSCGAYMCSICKASGY